MRNIDFFGGTGALADVVAFGPDGNRVELIMMPPSTGAMFVNLGESATTEFGFIVPNGTAPLRVTREQIGERICQEVRITNSTAGSVNRIAQVTTL